MEVVFAVLFGSQAQETAHKSSDIDIALYLPGEMDAYERFQLRNRVDANLQEYASGFVDVSDMDSLPIPLLMLRSGTALFSLVTNRASSRTENR